MFFQHTLWGSYELAVAVKLLLSALAGGLVGLEREKHGRPAGLRTHLLVAVGACLMMLVSEAIFLKFGGEPGSGVVRLDPGRIAAQIVTGIGFLGAGVIIKEGLSVRGLTTAACLWLVAGLGMAFGIGLFGPALLTTALSLASLLFLKRLETAIDKDRYLHLTVVAAREPDPYPQLERLFAAQQMRITDLEAELNLPSAVVRYQFVLTQNRQRMGLELAREIAALDGVREVRFR